MMGKWPMVRLGDVCIIERGGSPRPIEKFVTDKMPLWITGEVDIDADWDAYIRQLEQLGVKEYTAIQQAYTTRVFTDIYGDPKGIKP